ncbi:related to Protein C20orf43 [Ustilago trichophora]|uniref:Related to Protein C20orf43 n=1 Tax=Ustilago trichophora TaxID=86804 RepID=A0A5C3EI95_9BASI|nr:related to Protein C20orf43 [Ustilago trichophora]
MGNDGGSIAKRDELVRTKASFEKIDPELLRQSLWTVCSLSRQPLSPPVASDALGKLYNKDALLSHLLSRHEASTTSSSAKPVDSIPHIRGLKDITELKLTPNTLYQPPAPGSSNDGASVYPFACPLSGKQMDGNQRFVYIATCGCAMSATGLKTTIGATPDQPEETPCPVCAKPFNASSLLVKGKAAETAASAGSVVTINPSTEEEKHMREALEKTRAEEASRQKQKKKKDKARTADEANGKDGVEEEKAERKRRKAERKAENSAKIAARTAELAAEQ